MKTIPSLPPAMHHVALEHEMDSIPADVVAADLVQERVLAGFVEVKITPLKSLATHELGATQSRALMGLLSCELSRELVQLGDVDAGLVDVHALSSSSIPTQRVVLAQESETNPTVDGNSVVCHVGLDVNGLVDQRIAFDMVATMQSCVEGHDVAMIADEVMDREVH